MMDFLIYDVKVAVLIAVFYMFYRLMLAHETFHSVNRLVWTVSSKDSDQNTPQSDGSGRLGQQAEVYQESRVAVEECDS